MNHISQCILAFGYSSLAKRLSLATGLALILSSQTAMAQQLSVSAGSPVSQTGGSYTNTSAGTNGSAVYATGSGSSITGTGLTIGSGAFTTVFMVTATNGATIDLSKSTLNGGYGISADGNNSSITISGGSITSSLNSAATASSESAISLTDVAIKYSGDGVAAALAYGGTLNFKGGSVTSTSTGSLSGIAVSNRGAVDIDGTKVSVAGTGSAIRVLQGTANAKNFNLQTVAANAYGFDANIESKSTLSNGTIHTKGQNASGIWAAGNSTSRTTVTGDHVTIVTEGLNAHGIFGDTYTTLALSNSSITVNRAYGIYVQNGALASYENGTITSNGDNGVGVLAFGADTRANLDKATVKTTGAGAVGLYFSNGGVLAANNSSVETQGINSYGLYVASGSSATLTNTSVKTSGADAFGLVFVGVTARNTISLTGGSVAALEAAAVVANGGTDILQLKDTIVSGKGLLVVAGDYQSTSTGSKLSISADNSILSGGARISALSTNDVTLSNGSIWTLTAGADGTADSAVTSLKVENSTVAFAAPKDGVYQTLTVGTGASATPAWTGNGATLTLNTLLNAGGALSNQRTDRLLINGNVAGSTLVHVNGVAGSPGGLTSPTGHNLANEGISIIQASGVSTEKAFQLLGGYTTLSGLPYQYTLHAYGPTAANGAAAADQRVVAGSGDFWDYRLQNVYVEPPLVPPPPPPLVPPPPPLVPPPPPGPKPGPKPGPPPRAVAPQVAAYIVAPTALFQAGLQDISNLHRRLGEIRDDRASGRNNGTGEFFMRAYGGIYEYSSNRNAKSYGYDANIDYAAVQLGGNLYALQQKSSVTRFGVSGTIGTLSFDPKKVGHATQGDANTWSVSAHTTYLHNSGFYVDGIISTGAFDGAASTSLRGKTADLKGTSLALSVEAGYPFHLGNGLALEPQAQAIYQRLMFNRGFDVDNFVVALGDQDQVLGRFGVRLTKNFSTNAAQPVTVYAKANVLHAFSSGGKVFLGDTFTLGDFGTAIEGGIGISANLSKALSLYGDVAYQQKVGNSGVSGLSLTGGVRYAF